MTIYQGLPDPPLSSHPVLTIGNFDGQHRGHLALLTMVVNLAKQSGDMPMVLTFQPHPFQYFKPDMEFPFLTTFEQKISWFRNLGIEGVVLLKFNQQLANLAPEQFIFQVLRDGLHIRTLLVGEHFVFGRGRTGTTKDLLRLGPQANFGVQLVPPFQVNEAVVSSTRIRKLIQQGDVGEALSCLGRPYTLKGVIVEGEQRGKVLGCQTANLRPPQGRVIPADGVYVTKAGIKGQWYDSVSYIGTRPTFGPGERIMEVHLLDQTMILYGQEIEVNFIERLRGDETFDSAQALSERIQLDVTLARQKLKASPNKWNETHLNTGSHSSSAE